MYKAISSIGIKGEEVFEQQQYMYESSVHTVPNRIVSISQCTPAPSFAERLRLP